MKNMEDVKAYLRKNMELHRELAAGYEAAGENTLQRANQAKVDALCDVHQRLCIYFPEVTG